MNEMDIARDIVQSARKIHTALGPGLLEKAYEAVVAHEITKRGLRAERQKAFPVIYEGVKLDEGFRADLLVSYRVIVQIKAVEALTAADKRELYTYLRLADKRLGLLINFGVEDIRDGIIKVVNRPDAEPRSQEPNK